MRGLVDGQPRELLPEHQEVVGDDELDFGEGPGLGHSDGAIVYQHAITCLQSKSSSPAPGRSRASMTRCGSVWTASLRKATRCSLAMRTAQTRLFSRSSRSATTAR